MTAPASQLQLAASLGRLGTESAFEVLARASALQQEGVDVAEGDMRRRRGFPRRGSAPVRPPRKRGACGSKTSPPSGSTKTPSTRRATRTSLGSPKRTWSGRSG